MQNIASLQIESIDIEQNKKQTETALWKLSLLALFYKNYTLYKKNYCSNICQILTPLLCLAFTLVVRFVTQQITTGSVGFIAIPQPFHMPIVNKLMPDLKLHCTEKYYYSISANDSIAKQQSQQLFGHVLKTYCHQSDRLEPQFILSDHPNNNVMQELIQADQSSLKRGVDVLSSISDGIIKIHQLTNDSFSSSLAINDWRLPEYHQNNGVTKLDFHTQNQMIVTYLRVTQGLMSLIQKVTRSYLFKTNQKEVVSGFFMYMPFDGEDKSLINKATNVIGSGLYGLGLSLLLPIFLYGIVSDKEEKLIQIMKMNGLLMKYYWISFFIFNFILSLFSCCFLFFVGKYIFNIIFFSQTSWKVIFALFLGWSIAQVSLTAFVQIFINNSRTATIVGYLLSIFSSLVGQAISTVVYPYPFEIPIPLLFYPPMALARGVYLIGYSCANNSNCFQDIWNLNNQMYKALICLYSWFLMFILSTYLHDIVQQQYGASKLPICLKKMVKEQSQNNAQRHFIQNLISSQNLNYNESEIDEESTNINITQNLQNSQKLDQSVLKMKNLVDSLEPFSRPLIIKNICKTYDNGFQALKPNSFCLQQKQIFGLLGPNGAGKTTLMSVLTGLYNVSGGEAWIDGKQIGIGEANLKVGVCPQFDLLWDDMTILQHMKFYGLLKGIPIFQLEQKISDLLRDVDLLNERDLKSSQLSGGMRRRLSLAISLVGSPRVVFLDQPSSGLDPSHRRQMWDILKKCKNRTTILLTTHLMEEAEALCDRIGIINKGTLRCLGTQKYLKERFGQGYRLTLNFKQWKGQSTKITQQLLALGCETVNDLGSRLMLKVQKEQMLQCVKRLQKCDSLSWLLSQPSLYDVFMYFVN